MHIPIRELIAATLDPNLVKIGMERSAVVALVVIMGAPAVNVAAAMGDA